MPLLFERMKISKWDKYPQHERKSKIQKQYMKKRMFYPPLRDEFTTVSYTHLTLPTIYSV